MELKRTFIKNVGIHIKTYFLNISKNKIKFSILISFVFYIATNFAVVIQENHYKDELQKFDLNNDGRFQKNEITNDQKEARNRIGADTARTFAPFTLVPISIIFGALTYLVILAVTMISNKYRRTRK